MSLIPFSELVSALTVTDVRGSLYKILARLKVNTTNWAPGDPTRTMLAASSMMFAALSEFQRDIAASGFLEYARGPWLRMIARYVYDVEPTDATFATGEIVLTNQGGGLYSGGAGDLVVRNAVTGKAYRNVASYELGSGIGNTLTLTVVALEAGSKSNANTGDIHEFVTTLNRVTVTNPTALIGRDDESPAELRAKCREKLGALSPFGPWDAYSYAARQARLPSGASTGVNRTMITRDGYGHVYVTVATPTGALFSVPAIEAIDAAIAVTAEPLGVTAIVQSASPVGITIAYEAWVYNTSGLTVADMRALISDALWTFVSTHPIGGAKLADGAVVGYVFNEAITATIRAALPPGIVFHVNLVSLSEDMELMSGEVPTLIHNPESHGTIHLMKPPEGSLV